MRYYRGQLVGKVLLMALRAGPGPEDRRLLSYLRVRSDYENMLTLPSHQFDMAIPRQTTPRAGDTGHRRVGFPWTRARLLTTPPPPNSKLSHGPHVSQPSTNARVSFRRKGHCRYNTAKSVGLGPLHGALDCIMSAMPRPFAWTDLAGCRNLGSCPN